MDIHVWETQISCLNLQCNGNVSSIKSSNDPDHTMEQHYLSE